MPGMTMSNPKPKTYAQILQEQQAAQAASAARPAPGSDMPQAPAWQSMLDGSGKLNTQYQVHVPGQVSAGTLSTGTLGSGGTLKADKVSAETLKSGGTLTPQQIQVQKLMSGGTLKAGQLGNYNDVKVQSMMGDAQNRLNGVQANTQGLDALRQRALATGPSDWAKLQQQKLDLAQKDALDQSAKSSAGAMTNAMNQVAMRGGLSSGAGLRSAQMAARDQALQAQGIRRQGQMDNLNLGIADENQRLDLLKQLPQADLAYANLDLNKANALNSIQQNEQGLNLNADLANRQALMQKDMFNVGQKTDADKFNITNTQDVNKFNIGTALDKDKYNTSNKLAADQFNITNAQDVNKFNIGNAYDASKVNAANNLAANQFNIQNTQDVNKFNIATAADRDKYNISNAYDAKKTNIANAMNADQFNVGNSMKELDAGRQAELAKYQTQLAGWAAGKTGDAIAGGGKGGIGK